MSNRKIHHLLNLSHRVINGYVHSTTASFTSLLSPFFVSIHLYFFLFILGFGTFPVPKSIFVIAIIILIL